MDRIMNYIKQWLVRYRVKKRLRAIELQLQGEGKWIATPETCLALLEALEPNPWLNHDAPIFNLQFTSGFKNYIELDNWFNVLTIATKRGQGVPSELSAPANNRLESVSIAHYLTDHKTLSMWDVWDYTCLLKAHLTGYIRRYQSITDDDYRQRISTATVDVWADIMSVVEILCILGVSHEQ